MAGKPKPAKLRARRGRKAAAPVAAAEAEPFDEPATPPPAPNPSIEEPTTPGMREGEPEEACGLPDQAKTRPEDLH